MNNKDVCMHEERQREGEREIDEGYNCGESKKACPRFHTPSLPPILTFDTSAAPLLPSHLFLPLPLRTTAVFAAAAAAATRQVTQRRRERRRRRRRKRRRRWCWKKDLFWLDVLPVICAVDDERVFAPVFLLPSLPLSFLTSSSCSSRSPSGDGPCACMRCVCKAWLSNWTQPPASPFLPPLPPSVFLPLHSALPNHTRTLHTFPPSFSPPLILLPVPPHKSSNGGCPATGDRGLGRRKTARGLS